MEKETFIWSEDGVKVTSTTKVANGVQETTIRLDDGKDFLLAVFRLVFHLFLPFYYFCIPAAHPMKIGLSTI